MRKIFAIIGVMLILSLGSCSYYEKEKYAADARFVELRVTQIKGLTPSPLRINL